MKQKYTLTIADMDINVITEEPESSIEHIVGILDRKVREILLKSKRCSKNEAALLCALDFCADKVKLKEDLEEAESDLERANEELKSANDKAERAQRSVEALEREKSKLEVENKKLRDLLNKAKAGKTVTADEIEGVSEAAPAEDTYSAEAQDIPQEKEEKAPAQKKKNTGKNRVGSMFDLLTFSDI